MQSGKMKKINDVIGSFLHLMLLAVSVLLFASCSQKIVSTGKTAAEIMGDPNYQAISYGGYRE